ISRCQAFCASGSPAAQGPGLYASTSMIAEELWKLVQANAQTNWIGRAILALVVAGAATGTHFLFPDTSAIPFTPDQLRGAELSLNTAYLEHMTSQSATAAASQRPVAAGDPLGGVSDAAQGFEFRAGTAVTRPLLT